MVIQYILCNFAIKKATKQGSKKTRNQLKTKIMATTTIYQARQQAAVNINVPSINAEQVHEQMQPARVYRHELRMYRHIAKFIDTHPTLVNAALYTAGIATAVYTFLYY